MRHESSIDYLPNEILEIIFDAGARLSIALDERYPRQPLFSKAPVPPLFAISISQVCTRWRDIAIHTPPLWSFIHLSRSASSHKRLKSHLGHSLDWVPMYLVRSARSRLHVTLDTTRLPCAALDLICFYSNRWESFALQIAHVGSLSGILPRLHPLRIPKLKSLKIVSDIYREGIISYTAMPLFFSTPTPKLTSVRLVGVYLDWNATPLCNLTELELHLTSRWPAFAQLQEMFDASPLLQRLIIRDEITTILRNIGQPKSKPTIGLQSLSYLEVEVYRIRDGHADVAQLMGLFNMPVLETLVLKELKLGEWKDISIRYGLPLNHRALNVFERVFGRNRTVFTTFPFLSTLAVTESTMRRIISY